VPVRVVFCGGCNPVIDRTALADELRDDPDVAGLEIEIDMSGCSRSCAAGHELARPEAGVLVVAGRHLDGTPLDPAELATAIRQKLASAKE
jgi:hypothetical protein